MTELEEAAEEYSKLKVNKDGLMSDKQIKDFIAGAKWQAQRMYSDEDLVHLLNFVSKEYNISNGIGWFRTHESIEDVPSIDVLDKWFEQFKNKK